LVRTEAAVSPLSASAFSAFSAFKTEANWTLRKGGDRPCHQESAFSYTILLVQDGRPGSLLRR
jgi:hypothetical protein